MRKVEASPIVNTICALVFATFVFLYLFCFQGDLLIYAQHKLSGGTTVYNPFIGAILITTLLGLLSMISAKFFANNLYFIPAIYHLPSFLVLASLTDVRVVDDPTARVYGNTWIVAIVIFVVLLLINRVVKGFPFRRAVNMTDLLGEIVLNLTVAVAMIAFAVGMGNTDEMDHLTLRSEQLLIEHRYEEAALVGKKQVVGSRHMTTLRAFALGKTGEIGEKFFEMPVVGTSADLFPTSDNPMRILPSMAVYQFVGGVPSPGMDAKECLRLLNKRGLLRTKARDYLYLGKLIDRDIDGFVGCLAGDSVTLNNLPKHYREALTLYNHLRTQPKIDYSLPEMDADFDDFMAIIKKNPDKTLMENALRDSYGKTYWYYYWLIASKAFTQSVSSEN